MKQPQTKYARSGNTHVVDLVAGSGLEFDDRGEHDLKGVPRPWHIYAVTD